MKIILKYRSLINICRLILTMSACPIPGFATQDKPCSMHLFNYYCNIYQRQREREREREREGIAMCLITCIIQTYQSSNTHAIGPIWRCCRAVSTKLNCSQKRKYIHMFFSKIAIRMQFHLSV